MKLSVRIVRIFLFAVISVLPVAVSAQYYDYVGESVQSAPTPTWNIKSNLFYDLSATINLGAEFRLGGKTSLEVPVNYNPFTFLDNRKWKHIMVQPEFRFWAKDVFEGHFFGLHGHYAYYNISHLPEPFAPFMKNNRFQGDLYGGGLSYGYRWNFSDHWGMEATFGFGVARMEYDRYVCIDCGDYEETVTKLWLGPTKIGVNLVYSIGGKNTVREKRARNYGFNEYVPAPIVAPVPEVNDTPSYVIEQSASVAYEPVLSTSYVIPEVEPIKERSLTCTAYIDFNQGDWTVIPELENNQAEFARIHEMFRSVVGDQNAEITGVAVVGYASPEGGWEQNQILSERRTQAVMDHVNLAYNFPRHIFTVRGAGEDWVGLDSLVGQSFMASKDRVLGVIRGGGDPDKRESRLKTIAGGDVYDYIYDEFYPLLRRTDYRIDYTVIPFTVEQGKQVLRNRPNNLSLNELFLVANTYEPGSREFNEVFELAAQAFPSNDVANINAAASALERHDTATAAYYLAHVKELTPAYWNNLGVLAWMQNDRERAAQCFAEAGVQAAGNRSELEQYYKSIEE